MTPLSNIKKFIHNTRQNDDQGTKNQRFLGNMVLSTALSAPLFLFAKDDKVAQQTAIQDIIVQADKPLVAATSNRINSK